MRRAVVAFLAVVGVGVVAFVAFGALSTSRHAFSLGAPVSAPAITIRGGHSGCQRPIDVPPGADFTTVRMQLGTFGRPGPELRVIVRAADQRILAQRTVPAGYPDLSRPVVDFGRSIGGRGLYVCVENRGRRRVAIYGSAGVAVAGSQAEVDGEAPVVGGQPVDVDLALTFERPARSRLSVAGDVFDRATLFRSPRVSGAVYGLLLVVLLAGAVAALVVALRGAGRR